ERNVKCVGGTVRLLLPDEEVDKLPPLCQGALGATTELSEEQPYRGDVMPGTGNLLLHRDVIDHVGAFDESLLEAWGDSDLFRRISAAGYVSWFTPRAVVLHQVPRERLDPQYFYWTTRRGGWIRARIDAVTKGKLKTTALCALRTFKAFGVTLPEYLWA